MNLLLDISKHPPWGSRFTVNVQFNWTQNLVRKTFHSEEAKKTKVENCPFGVLLLEYVISINVHTVDSLFVAIFTAQTLSQSQQWKSKYLHLLSEAVCYYFEYMLSKRPEETYSVYDMILTLTTHVYVRKIYVIRLETKTWRDCKRSIIRSTKKKLLCKNKKQ